MTDSIQYREIAVRSVLSDFVLSLWEFSVLSLESGAYQHHVPPDGCVSIVVKYGCQGGPPLLIVVGPRTDTLNVEILKGDVYYGIRFWPQSASRVLGKEPEPGIVGPAMVHLPNTESRLAVSLPPLPDVDKVVEALSDEAAELASTSPPADSVVVQAVQRLVQTNGASSISNLAESLGISLRQLQRRFRANTGLSPKQFARVRRFRIAASELLKEEPRPWAMVAHEAGYSDQSHLAREFSQMIGLTAEELRAKQAVIDHEDVDP